MNSTEIAFLAPYALFAVGGSFGVWKFGEHFYWHPALTGFAIVGWLFFMLVAFFWRLSGKD